MLKTLSSHPAWRQLAALLLTLPVLVGLAVMLFTWPAARTQPRHLPVGVVGAGPTTERAVSAIEADSPDRFDLQIYGDLASARRAIVHRDVYGAIDVSAEPATIYSASAASPAVATLLTALTEQLAARADHQPGAARATTPSSRQDVRSVDVVATDAADPRGAVLASALLPLTICSIIIAAAIALVLEFGPAWRMVGALCLVSAAAGLAAYLVAQTWLSALPGHGVQTWLCLSLLVLAMSSTTAGLITLVGAPGLALGAVIMVFIGNPFSGTTSAPELLPVAADHVGQWLPPGAGANLVRSVTYFDGNGAGQHLAVLASWVLLGWLAVVSGHRSFVGFAAKRRAALESSLSQGAWEPEDKAPGAHAAQDFAVSC